ncbi:glycosyltransferase [Amphritea pacifica]|uniref:glycosyltransferase n=1 Tax=Amphritea pacifica TaxID=2811233 RepID=UPI0019643585|nr:glycosyltransferase [Amphritea pacifica]MBN1008735.1 glycosyltransferase [Amphritea pacifica]
MKTRILHIINGDLYSGAERVQDLLALRLPEFGYDVGFACVKEGKFPKMRMAKEAPLHLVPMKSRFDLGIAFSLARKIRDEDYALVHTHSPRAALVGRVASFLAGVPMVHHVHSPTSRDTEDPLRNRINTVIERFSLTGVKRLLPVSKSLERYLKSQGILSGKIRMVANGVPTPGQLPVREPPRTEWVIGSVALFRPRKGLEVLVEAIALLRDNGRSVRLRAVGPFETLAYENEIKSLADSLGVADNIDWVGFTQNVNYELTKLDAFVLPSMFGEGMPMVILEAMAMGVPVVASDVEGIPEVLEQSCTGLIVPPGDANALAITLDDLIGGRYAWAAMRKAAYGKQSLLFSDRSMAEGVSKVYQEILG